MNDIVHARLDPQTRRILQRLKRRYGWSDSEVVRQGIRALSESELPARERVERVIGLGKFESGVPDLASNKEHLRDFGK